MAARQAVTVELQALKDNLVSPETLTEAFGPSSLGIIIVKGLPPRFVELRAKVLSQASYLANLPEDELDALVSVASKYQVGWSHGKEAFKSGKPDTLKGSYYVNCSFYQDASLQCIPADGKHSEFTQFSVPNHWPQPSSMPGFREDVQELCSLIIDVAVLVAGACDKFAEANIEGYTRGYLQHVVKTSLTSKARLLHYFPQVADGTHGKMTASSAQDDNGGNDDDWCGTHLDHGCLTGLTSAMYIDEPADLQARSAEDRSQPLPELAESPDPESGLYISSRQGEVVKVAIPRDCLAFQTGEALQRITHGKFRAVPHFVKGAKTPGRNIARNTLAVFTQPNLDELVEEGKTFADFSREIVEKNY
ncbi:hypothetical protein KEM52_002832 [Ascosphaera acerosa]|nr:hypothetical protein KEM52_002832 [Ascosphaera acerosa]